jgi:hypothetical protein
VDRQRRDQAFVAVVRRHADVGDDQVGRPLRGVPQQLVGVRGYREAGATVDRLVLVRR